MKVLIWSKNIKIKNSGGPSGYLYNIKDYMSTHPQNEIDFYPVEMKFSAPKPVKKGWAGDLRNMLKWLASPIRFGVILYDRYFKKVTLSTEDMKLIENYDYVHIHYLYHVLRYFMSFDSSSTKLILTTHNPEPLIDQLAGEYNSEWMLKIPGFRNYFIKKEISAYEKVDYVMYPVEQAREPYINRSDLYKEAFKRLDQQKKFFYVPTALNTTDPCLLNNNTLSAYNIKDDVLKVCYVGRHNEVKGYDTVQKIAKQAWKEDIPVQFIIGGKEEPLKGLNDSRWIELGWVNTQALLNEVDVFILPNKDTYFDLILLEVLRQGTATMLTRTGGNKWFEGKSSGLFFYDYGNTEEAVSIIKKMQLAKSKTDLQTYKDDNMKFFRENLSMNNYIETYLHQLKLMSK